jgi:hypothetical protein
VFGNVRHADLTSFGKEFQIEGKRGSVKNDIYTLAGHGSEMANQQIRSMTLSMPSI